MSSSLMVQRKLKLKVFSISRTLNLFYIDVRERLKDEQNGNYVVVTAINPTPLGEGKS